MAPPTARSIKQVVTYKTILKGITTWFGQRAVVVCLYSLAAIRKIRNWHSHQGHIAGGPFRCPHRISARLRTNQYIDVAIRTLQKRELIDWTSGNHEGSGTGAIEGHPIELRLGTLFTVVPGPVSHPNVNRFRRHIENTS